MTPRAQFVQQIYQAGISAGLSDAAARVMAGQAAIESSYGAQVYGNNYFGVKAGSNWAGPTQVLWTNEGSGANQVRIQQSFRVYSSPEEAIVDRVALMDRAFPGFNQASTVGDALNVLQHGTYGVYYTGSQTDYESFINNVNETYLAGNPVPPLDVPSGDVLARRDTLQPMPYPSFRAGVPAGSDFVGAGPNWGDLTRTFKVPLPYPPPLTNGILSETSLASLQAAGAAPSDAIKRAVQSERGADPMLLGDSAPAISPIETNEAGGFDFKNTAMYGYRRAAGTPATFAPTGAAVEGYYPNAIDEKLQAIASPTTEPGTPANGFNTMLNATNEKRFQAWKATYAPNDSGEDYDLRGAFVAGLTPDPQTGHWPDTFKKPNHPTFSVESQYATYAPELAGSWSGDTYVPSPTSMSAIAGGLTLAGAARVALGVHAEADLVAPKVKGTLSASGTVSGTKIATGTASLAAKAAGAVAPEPMPGRPASVDATQAAVPVDKKQIVHIGKHDYTVGQHFTGADGAVYEVTTNGFTKISAAPSKVPNIVDSTIGKMATDAAVKAAPAVKQKIADAVTAVQTGASQATTTIGSTLSGFGSGLIHLFGGKSAPADGQTTEQTGQRNGRIVMAVDGAAYVDRAPIVSTVEFAPAPKAPMAWLPPSVFTLPKTVTEALAGTAAAAIGPALDQHFATKTIGGLTIPEAVVAADKPHEVRPVTTPPAPPTTGSAVKPQPSAQLPKSVTAAADAVQPAPKNSGSMQQVASIVANAPVFHVKQSAPEPTSTKTTEMIPNPARQVWEKQYGAGQANKSGSPDDRNSAVTVAASSAAGAAGPQVIVPPAPPRTVPQVVTTAAPPPPAPVVKRTVPATAPVAASAPVASNGGASSPAAPVYVDKTSGQQLAPQTINTYDADTNTWGTRTVYRPVSSGQSSAPAPGTSGSQVWNTNTNSFDAVW